jgi:D-tyrosyl-tRNA(Tyr) deacylase
VIGLLQRVSMAAVIVNGETIASIDRGILVLIGVEPNDDEKIADRLLERLLNYRIFADAAGKMNVSCRDVAGGLLLVPQFTLAADTKKGNRPSFSSAAAPAEGAALFDFLVERAGNIHQPVAAGRFGAHMQVSSTNDGPVTFWLQVD